MIQQEDEILIREIQSQFKNSRDMKSVFVTTDKNVSETIKWCREEFGQRGDGWDFAGSNRKVIISIWSSTLYTMWQLWQD